MIGNIKNKKKQRPLGWGRGGGVATERWREFQSEIAAALGRPLPLSECRMRGRREMGKEAARQQGRERKKERGGRGASTRSLRLLSGLTLDWFPQLFFGLFWVFSPSSSASAFFRVHFYYYFCWFCRFVSISSEITAREVEGGGAAKQYDVGNRILITLLELEAAWRNEGGREREEREREEGEISWKLANYGFNRSAVTLCLEWGRGKRAERRSCNQGIKQRRKWKQKWRVK